MLFNVFLVFKEKGVKILAVGVGWPNKPVKKAVFLQILSNNDKRLFEVNELKKLPSLLPAIVRESCKGKDELSVLLLNIIFQSRIHSDILSLIALTKG